MDRQTYEPTREDIDFVAGKRVTEDRKIRLTDAEAATDLARGLIRLVEREAQPAEDAPVEEPRARKAKVEG